MSEKARPNMVKLVTTCPNCKEPVEVYVSKKELKVLLKGFHAPTIREAQIRSEKLMEKFKQR